MNFFNLWALRVRSSARAQLKPQGEPLQLKTFPEGRAPSRCSEGPNPVLPFLVFLEFLVFCPCEEFLVFSSVFPFFSRDFRGSVGIKNPCFFGGFSGLFSKKNKERKDREMWERVQVGFGSTGKKRKGPCTKQCAWRKHGSCDTRLAEACPPKF